MDQFFEEHPLAIIGAAVATGLAIFLVQSRSGASPLPKQPSATPQTFAAVPGAGSATIVDASSGIDYVTQDELNQYGEQLRQDILNGIGQTYNPGSDPRLPTQNGD